MGLKHAYKSLKSDPADATIIGASKWNADHYFVDDAGAPIGNVGALLLVGAAGAVTHVNSVAAGVLASAGVGVAPAWTTSPTLTSIILGGVTLTGGDLSPLAGVTPGVVTASKAVVVDANKDIASFRNLTTTGNLTFGAGAMLESTGLSRMWAPSVGNWLLQNSGGTDFNRLQFGGTTSAFPALKRSAYNLELRLADDSGYASLLLNNLRMETTGYFYWAGLSTIKSPGNGIVRLTNYAEDDFNRLQFGGGSAAYPALKRSGTELQVKLGDDSAYAPLAIGNPVTAGAAVPSTHKVAINIGGTTYFLLASNI